MIPNEVHMIPNEVHMIPNEVHMIPNVSDWCSVVTPLQIHVYGVESCDPATR